VSIWILLPPSERKAPGGDGRFDPGDGTFGALGPYRRAVAAALAALPGPAAARLTGLSGARGVDAASANGTLVEAPVLPAWERYQGVVWDHLDAGSLRGPAHTRARRVLVPSAVGGLWALSDPVPDYKLKMAATLPGIGSVTAHWRSALPEALWSIVGRGTVVDMLPSEHRRALPLHAAAGRVVRVDFVTAAGTGAAGHAAKAAKGRLARHLLDAGGDPCAAGEGFEWDGWTTVVPDRRTVVVTAPA
jgi:cytoplasmic iron level regulating protein YaaA (DUF328/UPF0246 family)